MNMQNHQIRSEVMDADKVHANKRTFAELDASVDMDIEETQTVPAANLQVNETVVSNSLDGAHLTFYYPFDGRICDAIEVVGILQDSAYHEEGQVFIAVLFHRFVGEYEYALPLTAEQTLAARASLRAYLGSCVGELAAEYLIAFLHAKMYDSFFVLHSNIAMAG